MLELASQPFSNMDSLGGSDLGGSVNLFCPSVLIMFHHPNSSEVSLFSACMADLSGSSCNYFLVYVGESQRFLEGLPCDEEMSQEIFSLPSVIFVS